MFSVKKEIGEEIQKKHMGKQDIKFTISFVLVVVLIVLYLIFVNQSYINKDEKTKTQGETNIKVELELNEESLYDKYELNIVSNYKDNDENASEYEIIIEERPNVNVPLDDELLDYIWKKSNEYEFAFAYVLAILGVESDFGSNTYNLNKNGSYDSGIAQINSSNVEFLAELAGIKNPDMSNDYHNIDMMLELLNYEREYFRSLGYSEEDVFVLTTLAYNMGRGNTLNYIDKYGLIENKYVQKVMNLKESLENEIYGVD